MILLLYIFTFQRFKVLFYLVFSSLIFLVFIHLFFYLQNIPLNLILEQYFYFPMTIADQRYSNLSFTFDNIIFNFKFIYFFNTTDINKFKKII